MQPADREAQAPAAGAPSTLDTETIGAPSTLDNDTVDGVMGRGSLYAIATAVQLASGLLTIPILTRVLDPTQYGVVTAALVVQAVLVNVAAFGLPVAVQRTHFGRGGAAAGRSLIGATLLGAILVCAVAFATGPLWAGIFDDVPWDAVLQLAVISAIPSALLLSAQLALQAEDRVRPFLVSAGMGTLGAQGFGLALAAAFDDPAAYMAGLTIGFTAAALIAWLAAGVEFGALRPARGGRDLLTRSLALGLPTIPHGLALYLLSAGDRVVIERLEGLPAAGAYYVAYAIGGLGVFLVAGLKGAWQPAVFGAGEERRWPLLATTGAEVTRVIALTVAGLAIGAPCALAVFAPSDYEVAGLGSVSALVAAATFPYLWVSLDSTVVVWSRRTLIFAIATPISVAANLALCALLVPPMGLEGAALATLFGYALLALLTRARARRLAAVPWDMEAMLVPALAAAAAVGLALVLPDDGVWLAVRGVAAAALAVLAVARLAGARRLTATAG